MTCNIGTKGRIARFIWGIALIAAAGLLALWGAWPRHSLWMWIVSALLAGGGGFAIFEARAGWCAMRAMGYKTRW